MSLRLLKYGFIEGHSEEKWIPRPTSLKKKYDVVIIGGGGHGLACAYYLAKEHNITDVAVPVSYTHLTLPTNREV